MADNKKSKSARKGSVMGRLLNSSLDALATSEESIRERILDMKLPKDAMEYLAAQGQRQRDEVVKMMSKEIREFLEDLDYDEELRKFAENYTVKFEVTLNLDPKEPKNPRKAKVKAKTKTVKKKKPASAAAKKKAPAKKPAKRK